MLLNKKGIEYYEYELILENIKEDMLVTIQDEETEDNITERIIKNINVLILFLIRSYLFNKHQRMKEY